LAEEATLLAIELNHPVIASTSLLLTTASGASSRAMNCIHRAKQARGARHSGFEQIDRDNH
jgi:hypothetical protein